MEKAYRTAIAYTPSVAVDGQKTKMTLPDGCIGICYVFKTVRQAEDFLGAGVDLTEVEYEIREK